MSDTATSSALPPETDVVVIGGGIAGCSTAFHLAADHGVETVLLEQNSLTSGSTWHAAGLVGQLRSSSGVTELLKNSVALYRDLSNLTGLETGWKMSGCLRLACCDARMAEYREAAERAAAFGMDMHLLSSTEAQAMIPLLDVSDCVGASFLPSDGQANPSDITMSLAKGARDAGAELMEGVRVTGLTRDGDTIHALETTAGTIRCRRLVLCAGMWTRQLAALAGIDVPLHPVKHQYVVTEPIEGVAADMPSIRDPDRRTYFKEEVGGLAFGGYEPDPQIWAPDTVPHDFAFSLFDDDWEHFEQHTENAVARIPALADAGIKQMVHGAESFTPDGYFLLGPAEAVDNVFIAAGFNAFGIAAGGGAGWALARWIVDGIPPLDLAPVSADRFGDRYADVDQLRSDTLRFYADHYALRAAAA